MEEVKCDGCVKVINGYYPDAEIQACDYYKHSLIVPGMKKANINCVLEVDAREGNKPIKYTFCSIPCLEKSLDHIKKLIDR